MVLAEAAALGGTCVNVGCIPKRSCTHAAHFADDIADAVGFGWDLDKPRLTVTDSRPTGPRRSRA